MNTFKHYDNLKNLDKKYNFIKTIDQEFLKEFGVLFITFRSGNEWHFNTMLEGVLSKITNTKILTSRISRNEFAYDFT